MGGYSQIDCEIRLLEEALKNKEIEYFHLLTGQDLPLVNIKEILDFFKENKEKNFIHFDRKVKSIERYERIKYYRLFQELAGRNKNIYSILQNKLLLPLQKLLKIDRSKRYKGIEFKSGSAYFSITREFAEYIMSNEKNIKEWFSFAICGDEMFIQTLAYNSKFKETLYNTRFNDNCLANQRYIDWNSGSPYTWRISDFQDLKESNCLFARKFDEEIDSLIIEKVIESIQK